MKFWSLFPLLPSQNIIKYVNIYILCKKVLRVSSFWKYIKEIILTISFSDLLLSLNDMCLRFNHVDGIPQVHSSLLPYNVLLYEWKAMSYFCSSDRHWESLLISASRYVVHDSSYTCASAWLEYTARERAAGLKYHTNLQRSFILINCEWYFFAIHMYILKYYINFIHFLHFFQ